MAETNLSSQKSVLILGAGVNGCAAARELVLNGVPVCIVERSDIAWGATSRSSRLIHGGLRYLEHGEFRLVRESLDERSRLRRLAPQFVRPFRLHIPVAKRTGGLFRSATHFFSGGRWGRNRHAPRGLWLVRLGLWFYDRFVSDPDFPHSEVVPAKAADAPQVDASRYRWLCRYTDAQMIYPERFVLSMLTDARAIAEEKSVDFEVWTYHEVRRDSEGWNLIDRETGPVIKTLDPALVINATGAWGDLTLDDLSVPAPQLFGGTKGSHFVTYQAKLLEAAGPHGVYAEADDGRLVFILPMAGGVMVGTTDERFEGNPDNAVASEPELDYLIEMVNELFPQVSLVRDDVVMHCAGVRPLPREDGNSTSAISRDHSIHTNEAQSVTILTLVGGKLTTARAFGEAIADEVLPRLHVPRTADTRERAFPGGENYPPAENLQETWDELARRFDRPVRQIAAMWALCGTRVAEILSSMSPPDPCPVAGTDLPRDFVRWVIRHEWVSTLGDLVERRLMLIYQYKLPGECLNDLADLLMEEGRMKPDERETKIEEAVVRLKAVYGKDVVVSSGSPSEPADSAAPSPHSASK